MRLIIQVPCYNEAETLPAVLRDLPRAIAGIDEVQVLIIDDGSQDGTHEVALAHGVDHVVRHRNNRGLAAAFQSGLTACLLAGADIIVNTDGDNQYHGGDVAKLVRPIIEGKADIVIGDRRTSQHPEFSGLKKLLQRIGTRVAERMGGLVVDDAVSGFRAMTADAAMGIQIHSAFSYTTEMLIHAGYRGLAVQSVPIRTNPALRSSRLYKSMPSFIARSATTMLRAYVLYHPLKVFLTLGLVFVATGLWPILRFLVFYYQGDGAGHIQSLVLGVGCLILGALAVLLALIADLLARNRRLAEATLERTLRLEVLLRRQGKLIQQTHPTTVEKSCSVSALDSSS